MTRFRRIALNVLCPPTMAAGFIGISSVVFALGKHGFSGTPSFCETSRVLFSLLLITYLVATLPGIVHTAFMEWIYGRWSPHTWPAVGFSSLSGLVVGTFITWFMLSDCFSRRFDWILLFLSGIGALVGFVLGVCIKWISRPASPNAELKNLSAAVDRLAF